MICSTSSISLRFFHNRDEPVPEISRRVTAQPDAAGCGESLAQGRIRPDFANAVRDRLDRLRIDENGGIPGLFANATYVGSDHRAAESPCFENRNVCRP